MLENADDDELIRLLYAHDRGSDVEEAEDLEELMDSLATQGLVHFTLEERGYSLSGDPGELIICDTDDEVVAPDFIDVDS